jgi:hypothetical protein
MAARPILDWSLQTLVLRRLCADRAAALAMVDLVAAGERDEEVQASLKLSESQFKIEVDQIAVAYERLSRAFYAHAKLGGLEAGEISDEAGRELVIIAASLRGGASRTADEVFEEVRGLAFGELVGRIEKSLVEPFAALDRLPALLCAKVRGKGIDESQESADSGDAEGSGDAD